MMNEIIKGNKNKKIENLLFSEEYLKFVTDFANLIPSLNPTSSLLVFKYEIIVFLTIFIRQKQELPVLDFLKSINSMLKENTDICDWILQAFSSHTALEEVFENNPSKDRKKLLAFWLVDILQYSRESLK